MPQLGRLNRVKRPPSRTQIANSERPRICKVLRRNVDDDRKDVAAEKKKNSGGRRGCRPVMSLKVQMSRVQIQIDRSIPPGDETYN